TTGGNFPEQCNTVRHCEHNSNLDKSVLRRLVRLMPFMSSTLQSSKIPLDFYANLYFPENALKSMATLLSETRDSGGKDATEQIRKGAVKNGYLRPNKWGAGLSFGNSLELEISKSTTNA
ncbi:unnamed protein product, partial [Allacma fusca]